MSTALLRSAVVVSVALGVAGDRLLAQDDYHRTAAEIVWPSGGNDDRDLAVRLARRRDADLYVVAEGGEKFHQALGRKGTCSSTHQVRDVRLRNAEELAA